MVTQYRGPANTQLASSTGGTISLAETQDLVVKWAQALEPTDTPFLSLIQSNEEISNPVHQWGQSRKILFDTTLSAGIDNAVTVVPVATGTGLLFKAQATIMIANFRTGSTEHIDEANAEYLWVKSISGDNLTVDTRGTYSTAAAHASGAQVYQLAGAEPENGEHAEAPRNRGFRLFNYFQRPNAKITSDKRYQGTATWESPSGNAHLEDYAAAMRTEKELLERSVFRGVRYIGSADPANPRPSMFGGLNTFLTTNTINMAGATIQPSDLDAVMVDLWKTLGGSANKKWYMGIDEGIILDTAINPIRRATVSDDSLNTTLVSYKSRAGTFRIEHMRNIPNGNLYLLDTSLIKLRPYKGLNWHKGHKDGAAFAVDNDVDAISGDFTLEVLQEHSMARIYNFDMNINNYPTPEFY